MHLTIGMLASRPVIAVDADTPALQALKLMDAHGISCVLVSRNAEPVGILTERDVVFTANWLIGQPSLRLGEVMSKPVLATSAAVTPSEARQLFQENEVRHLVVLGPRMEISGLFTLTDLVKALKDEVFQEHCRVANLMSRRVLGVAPQATARQALALMASQALSSVVVADAGRPIGMFSARDVVKLVAAERDLAGLPVASVMSAPVVSIQASASPCRAIDLMQKHAVRHLLVTNEQDDLVGILTQTDMSRVFVQQDRLNFDADPRLPTGVTHSGQEQRLQ